MRSFIVLSALALAAAGELRPLPDMKKTGHCLVDGVEAASELMDSAMFIWAAVARCGHSGEEIKCEINIASSIESINAMINVILKALDKCGALHIANQKCGLAASALSESSVGIAAATGGIIAKCPGSPAGSLPTVPKARIWKNGPEVNCVVDLKNAMTGLMKGMRILMSIKKGCTTIESQSCEGTALTVIAALAGLGEYLAGVVGHCTHHMKQAECAEQVSRLVSNLGKVAKTGIDMSHECKIGGVAPEVVEVQVPQLFEEFDERVDRAGFMPSTANFILAAFLPVAGIVGFVGGRFIAPVGGRPHRTHFSRQVQEAVEEVETPMIQVQ